MIKGKCIFRILLLAIIIAVVIVILVEKKRINEFLEAFIGWLQENPNLGPFILVLMFIVTTVLFIPAAVLTVGAGLAFKQAYKSIWYALLTGSLSVWLGASIGACCAMLIGRFMLKEQMIHLSRKYPIVNAIDRAIE